MNDPGSAKKASYTEEKEGKQATNRSTAYYNQGMVLLGLRRYQEAIDFFQKATCLNGSCAQGYYYMGLALRAISRYNEAIVAFRKAIKLNPNSTYAHDQLSGALIDLSETLPPSQAKACLEQALDNAEKAFQLSDARIGCYNMARAIAHRKKLGSMRKGHASFQDK